MEEGYIRGCITGTAFLVVGYLELIWLALWNEPKICDSFTYWLKKEYDLDVDFDGFFKKLDELTDEAKDYGDIDELKKKGKACCELLWSYSMALGLALYEYDPNGRKMTVLDEVDVYLNYARDYIEDLLEKLDNKRQSE